MTSGLSIFWAICFRIFWACFDDANNLPVSRSNIAAFWRFSSAASCHFIVAFGWTYKSYKIGIKTLTKNFKLTFVRKGSPKYSLDRSAVLPKKKVEVKFCQKSSKYRKHRSTQKIRHLSKKILIKKCTQTEIVRKLEYEKIRK